VERFTMRHPFLLLALLVALGATSAAAEVN
jgi:hypothetical protein